LGYVILKTLGHGSREFLSSDWLRVSHVLDLSLHKGVFGLQPLTFSIYEIFTWDPTQQVWIMSANIIRGFLGTTLEARFGGNVWQEVGFT
jgi:hypothetical protein